MYDVILSKKAAKFISNLPSDYKDKIRTILSVLKENPYGYPYKKIRGETSLYRIRVGKYRILYEVDKRNRRVIILKVDEREKVYRKL